MTYTARLRSYQPLALGAAIAGLLGAGLGMLFAPKRGKELRDDVRGIAHKAVSTVRHTASDVDEAVRDAFGDTSRTLTAQYLALKGDILNAMHDHGAGLTREHYDELVDDTVARYARAKRWSKAQADKLGAQMKKSWASMRAETIEED